MGTRTFARRRSPSCRPFWYNTNIVRICIIAFAGRHDGSLVYGNRDIPQLHLQSVIHLFGKLHVYCTFVCDFIHENVIIIFNLLLDFTFFLFYSDISVIFYFS